MAFTRSEIKTSRGELIWKSLSLDGSVTPANEYPLGFTDSGIEIDRGEWAFLDPNEESGRGPGVAFFAGQDIRLRTVLRQWNEKNLEVAFPGQFDDTGTGRVEIPGDLTPGDDLLSYGQRLLLRPTDPTKDPYILAMKAVLVASRIIEFGTLRIRKLALEFQLYPDDTLVGGAQETYRTLGIGDSTRITHP